MTLNQKFNRWIFDSYRISPENLGLFRIIYALYFLFINGLPKFEWIAAYPNALFTPPIGIARFFPGFPPELVLNAFGYIIALLFIFLLFGYKTRFVSLAITCVAVLAKSFDYSLGKICHDLLPWMIPFVMSFSNWGAAYSIDAKKGLANKEVASWPITWMSIILGFAMFTAGYPKMMGGWMMLDSLAVKNYLLSQYFVHENTQLLASFFVNIESPIVWEFFDWAPIIFEIGFLAAIIRPSIFRAFTIIALTFHLMNMLILNIGFEMFAILYLLFWAPLFSVNHTRIASYFNKIKPAFIVAFGLLYMTMFHFIADRPLLIVTDAVGIDYIYVAVATWAIPILIFMILGVRYVKKHGVINSLTRVWKVNYTA